MFIYFIPTILPNWDPKWPITSFSPLLLYPPSNNPVREVSIETVWGFILVVSQVLVQHSSYYNTLLGEGGLDTGRGNGIHGEKAGKCIMLHVLNQIDEQLIPFCFHFVCLDGSIFCCCCWWFDDLFSFIQFLDTKYVSDSCILMHKEDWKTLHFIKRQCCGRSQ